MGLVIERWRPVVGFEDGYEVSDLGNVRSLDRLVNIGRGFQRLKRGKLLRPGRMPGGHLSVVVGRKRGSKCVHVLVLEAFEGPAPEGTEVCHNDGNPANNRLTNLRWDTRGNNMRDVKYHAGRSNYKLGPDDVRAIRGFFGLWEQRKIAKVFGISETVVSKIKLGKLHADVI